MKCIFLFINTVWKNQNTRIIMNASRLIAPSDNLGFKCAPPMLIRKNNVGCFELNLNQMK